MKIVAATNAAQRLLVQRVKQCKSACPRRSKESRRNDQRSHFVLNVATVPTHRAFVTRHNGPPAHRIARTHRRETRRGGNRRRGNTLRTMWSTAGRRRESVIAVMRERIEGGLLRVMKQIVPARRPSRARRRQQRRKQHGAERPPENAIGHHAEIPSIRLSEATLPRQAEN